MSEQASTPAGERRFQSQVIFVVGPTACGKSDLAVEICESLASRGTPAEIINCDSIQFFDGVQIGAAKPEPELLRRARHHLIGHIPLGGAYTAGDFSRDAHKAIEEGLNRGIKHFIAVGGSGFYVQALEKGMYEVPPVPGEIREQLETEIEEAGGQAKLYEELSARDAETASRIQPADRYRILRSLEILRANPTGGTLSEIRVRFEAKQSPPPFDVAKIGLYRPRDILRLRVTERTKRMIAQGLLSETQSLREQGFKDWPPLHSVGYKEAQSHLDGQISLEEMEAAIITSTMQLAKRQMTWFKRDPSIRWFDAEQGFAEPLAVACALALADALGQSAFGEGS